MDGAASEALRALEQPRFAPLLAALAGQGAAYPLQLVQRLLLLSCRRRA